MDESGHVTRGHESLIAPLGPSFYRPGSGGSFSNASESRKSDRSHRLRVPGRRRCNACAALRVARAETWQRRACQTAQQRTPFHGLLFFLHSLSLAGRRTLFGKLLAGTCAELAQARGPACIRCSHLALRLSLSLQLPASFSLFSSAVQPPSWNIVSRLSSLEIGITPSCAARPLHLGIIDRPADGGRERDR